MFGKLFSSSPEVEKEITRQNKSQRTHPRRAGDKCVTLIDGKMYPIENWSNGGMLIAADERLFAIEQDCDVTLKFKLRNEMINIPHKAKVVRKSSNKIGMQFAPINKKIQSEFQKVVDDFVSQRFADSHSA
ncbi:MAG: PilZ domain-containing protein [Alphaproteobacteria bacterium]|nr:PilZ domain-containing protein [Alphaproteobacteria bacterium]